MDDLEALTMSLVVQMHLEDDLRELAEAANRKGKDREGEVSDSITAIEAYRAELSSHAQLLADKAMSQSMARAVALDASAIRAVEEEEERNARDRDMAFRLSGERNPNPMSGSSSRRGTPAPTLSDEMTRNMNVLANNSHDEDDDSTSLVGRAESSSWAASRGGKKTSTCIACANNHSSFNIIPSPGCHHEYCRECLRSLFQAAMTDETLFPPKCCGLPIPVDLCRSFLPAQLLAQFQAKKTEFETPNRTYCCQPTCSTFVPPQAITGGVGRCERCHTLTCTVCKKAAHANTDCPEDPATQELLRLAQAEGWQKCYSCARFVELQYGCNHITCRCGAQFCYVCGDRWKTCTCPQWEEQRLVHRANAIVNRDAGARRLGPADLANYIEHARRNLVANHQCAHATWDYRFGRHRCEECGDTLPTYILECRQCRIMACHRCRYNRFA